MTTDPSRRVGQLSADSLIGDVLPTSSLPSEEPIEDSVRARMHAQRWRDTAPELDLRRALHRLGLRYRVDHPLPGMPRRRADVVFSRAELAVFVDGCFWHSCPQHGTTPKSRSKWWTEKLCRNVERDRDTDKRLVDEGWAVLRIWEHEDMAQAALEVQRTYHCLLISGQNQRASSSTTGGRNV